MQTRGPWILLPENRAAWQAVERVRECVCRQEPVRQRGTPNPLLLHGPPGTGKTHLVADLAAEVTRRLPASSVALLPASELAVTDDQEHRAVRRADLVIVEDVQHLARRRVEVLVQLIDRCLPRQRQVV